MGRTAGNALKNPPCSRGASPVFANSFSMESVDACERKRKKEKKKEKVDDACIRGVACKNHRCDETSKSRRAEWGWSTKLKGRKSSRYRKSGNDRFVSSVWNCFGGGSEKFGKTRRGSFFYFFFNFSRLHD